MEVRFELLTLFREKAGAGELTLEVEGLSPGGPLLEALLALEARFAGAGLRVLESAVSTAGAAGSGEGAAAGAAGAGAALRPGVLVFLRDAAGTLVRAREANAPLPAGTRSVVLSTAMEGG